ncbi:MAG: hypothetical protein IJ297_05060 [Clostridia bacterium]|nr:hypothetical protein [Clostridia bacterium]
MKKIVSIALLICMCLSLCACGVKLDENEAIVGNGTWQVTKSGDVYTIMDNTVKKNDAVLYEINNIKDYKLFALGEYLYVNTLDGAMQLFIDGSKMKKFGSGDIIAARGRWIYYQSKDNKVGNMIVYKIDMVEGRQLNLFQDTITTVEMIEPDVFLFTGESGNEYINELNEDNGYFYHEWLGTDPTEATE